jgi:hypothetical protein
MPLWLWERWKSDLHYYGEIKTKNSKQALEVDEFMEWKNE